MKEIHISEMQDLANNRSFIKGLFNDKDFDVCFHYQSDFQKTQLLRDIVDIIADLSWLDAKWRRRVVLIVDELNNNAIEYGSSPNSINKMRFSLQTGAEISLNIEVEDSGTGKDAKTAKSMRELQSKKLKHWFENHNSIRGRWLFMIIENLVDELYFKDSDVGWLIVWVTKHFT